MAGVNLQAVGDNALSSVQRMPPTQRLTLGLAFVATVIGLFLVAQSTRSTPMATLFTGLDPSVASEVTAELDNRDVPYELSSGGQVVAVPAAQVHQLRIDLAAQNLPGGAQGYELIDDIGMLGTSFEQRVAYQRALEGELERTISAIDTVRSADVNLVIPEYDLFPDDSRRASAAVVIDTGATALGAMQVQAVTNLVASSVEGLTTDAVSVVDQAGRVLSAPGDSMTFALENDSWARARMQVEAELESDLENMLANLVGPGGAVVNVTADMSFDSGSTTTEELVPLLDDNGEQLFVNERTNQEFIRDDSAFVDEGGQLEIELPEDLDLNGDDNIDDTVNYARDDAERTGAFTTRVQTTDIAPGAVTGLSVAVLLDEEKVEAGRVADIEQLVQNSVPFDVERGDSMAVTLMPFDEGVKTSLEAAAAAAAEEPAGPGLDLVSLLRTIGTIVVALVVLLLAIRSLSRSPRRPEPVTREELAAAAKAAALAELGTGDLGFDQNQADLGPPEERLQALIANQTNDVADVLRTWLDDNEKQEVPVPR